MAYRGVSIIYTDLSLAQETKVVGFPLERVPASNKTLGLRKHVMPKNRLTITTCK